MSNLWLNMRIGKYRIQCGRDNGLTIRKFEGLDRKWKIYQILKWHF